MRPVGGFAYEIRLLRLSDLLRTYTTCALEEIYAYVVRLLRSTRLIAYVVRLFVLKATYASGFERPIVR